jgi:hypothetical protein
MYLIVKTVTAVFDRLFSPLKTHKSPEAIAPPLSNLKSITYGQVAEQDRKYRMLTNIVCAVDMVSRPGKVELYVAAGLP